MLIDRTGEVGEVAELTRRRGKLSQPVVAQAEQLAYRGDPGIRLAERTQDAQRVALVAGVERLGRALELLERVKRLGPATRRSSTLASVERTGRRRVGAALRDRFEALTGAEASPPPRRTRRSEARSFGATGSGDASRLR